MFSPCLLLVLEGFTFARAVFSIADVFLDRSVIDLGGDIVVEGIRLPADLRFVFDEILIALSICAVNDDKAHRALECLGQLRNCEAHSTVILSQVDENTLKKLGLNLTCEPQYQTKRLFHG